MKSFWFFGDQFFPSSLKCTSYMWVYVRCLCQSDSIVTHTFKDTCNMQTTQIRASWFMSTVIRWGALPFRWIVCVCSPFGINLPKTQQHQHNRMKICFLYAKEESRKECYYISDKQPSKQFSCHSNWWHVLLNVCTVLSMSCDKSSAVQKAKKKKKQSNK